MRRTRVRTKLLWSFAAILLSYPTCLRAQKVTVDDLMGLRSVNDVRISADGNFIAYVVSTPSLEKAAHEAVLYRVPFGSATPLGGTLRLTYRTRIFNQPIPAPWLRWSPDGSRISFIGYVD